MKCLACVGEMVLAEVKNAKGEEVPVPEPEEAWTMAPSWQEKRVGQQLVMACIAIPTCKRHLTVDELSPIEQAIRNGKLLEGTMQPNAGLQ